MNKKIIAFALVWSSALTIFAELAAPRRYFEIGFDVAAGVSNNYFNVKDFAVKDLVIDLQKFAREIPKEGLTVDYDVNIANYMSFDISKNFRMKMYASVTGSGYGNIGHGLFDLLGEGISANSNKTIDVNIYGDLFVDTGISVKTDIKGYGVKIVPAYFIPLVHIAQTSGAIRYTSSDSGKIRADVDVPLNIYSIVDLDGIKDKKIDGAYISNALSDAVRSGGFDISAEVEHKITETFDLGVLTRIPLVPGTLKHKASSRYWAYFEQNNLLGYLDGTESSSHDYGHDEMVYSDDSIKIHRPFMLGAEGAWRPFGDWCIFRPELGFVVRNPFSSEYQVFGEYGLNVEFFILKVLGFNFGTEYKNLTFRQTMGFAINTRVVETGAFVQLRGGDFANSFGLSGATAGITVKIGF